MGLRLIRPAWLTDSHTLAMLAVDLDHELPKGSHAQMQAVVAAGHLRICSGSGIRPIHRSDKTYRKSVRKA
jgi:hypothetical protein